jgi:hypothetical protein
MTDLPDPPAAVPRVRALVYARGSGRILHEVTNLPLDMVAAQPGPGQGVLVTDVGAGGGDGSDRWYVVGSSLVPRPVLAFDKVVIAADGQDTATLDIGAPFSARIDGALVDVADRLEIVSDMPGRYRVQVEEAFPFRDLDVEIVAT